MNEQELAELAAKVAKSLRWAGFLLAAMLVILVIDLQLKRSIARKAVAASKLFTSATLRFPMEGDGGGRTTVAADSRAAADAGDAGRGGMDGAPPVAAGTDQASGPAEDVPVAAPGGPRKRAPGNGRRAQRPDTGS